MTNAMSLEMLAERLPEATVRACERRLRELNQRVGGRVSSVLAGPDGLEVATQVERTQSGPKLAALASTLAAVGEALTRETGLAACDALIVETKEGAAVIQAIPAGDDRFSLVLVAQDRALLGKLLLIAKESGAAIGRELASRTEIA